MKSRKILCALLASAILWQCSDAGCPSAPGPSQEALLDAALAARGYPRLVLDSMNPKAKEALSLNSNLTFHAACIVVYDGETGRSRD